MGSTDPSAWFWEPWWTICWNWNLTGKFRHRGPSDRFDRSRKESWSTWLHRFLRSIAGRCVCQLAAFEGEFPPDAAVFIWPQYGWESSVELGAEATGRSNGSPRIDCKFTDVEIRDDAQGTHHECRAMAGVQNSKLAHQSAGRGGEIKPGQKGAGCLPPGPFGASKHVIEAGIQLSGQWWMGT